MIRLLIATAFVLSLTTTAWAGATARSFAHTATTTASRVEPPSGSKSYDFIRCWQASASPVYLGGKDVSPTNGYPICSNVPGLERRQSAEAGPTCEDDTIELRVSDLYAVAWKGTQSLVCIVSGGD
jgi:hypothetical protein